MDAVEWRTWGGRSAILNNSGVAALRTTWCNGFNSAMSEGVAPRWGPARRRQRWLRRGGARAA